MGLEQITRWERGAEVHRKIGDVGFGKTIGMEIF